MIGFNWLTRHFSNRGKALSLFRRASAWAKKHDHQGAIEDYTTATDMLNTADDVKAIALYNRGLVHVATGDDQKGVDDFDAVLAMDEAEVSVKTMARKKIARLEFRSAQVERSEQRVERLGMSQVQES